MHIERERTRCLTLLISHLKFGGLGGLASSGSLLAVERSVLRSCARVVFDRISHRNASHLLSSLGWAKFGGVLADITRPTMFCPSLGTAALRISRRRSRTSRRIEVRATPAAAICNAEPSAEARYGRVSSEAITLRHDDSSQHLSKLLAGVPLR